MSAEEGGAMGQGAQKSITKVACRIGWNDDGKFSMEIAGTVHPVVLAAMLRRLADNVESTITFDEPPKSKVIPIRALPDIVNPHANGRGR